MSNRGGLQAAASAEPEAPEEAEDVHEGLLAPLLADELGEVPARKVRRAARLRRARDDAAGALAAGGDAGEGHEVGAVADDGTVHSAALLERLLEELCVMERCVAQACAEMEALRGRCIRAASQLGRMDLLERRNLEK